MDQSNGFFSIGTIQTLYDGVLVKKIVARKILIDIHLNPLYNKLDPDPCDARVCFDFHI